MGRKNRNKKKKEKEGDGSTGNVNGGNNNNNNNHNHNISIPTVDETVVATTTTTTIVLTKEELEDIDNSLELKCYPKSNDFFIGYRLLVSGQEDPAIASFKRGADNNGCVPCMCFYMELQRRRGNFHFVVPIALEGAVRGHIPCISILLDCYNKVEPVKAMALASLWTKMTNELDDTQCKEENRKKIKKEVANYCTVCGKEESEDNNDVTLVKCGICKYYSYCGKDCQTYHWKEGKHMNECRQVIMLRKYCKPSYVKEIRKAIIDGQDPKEIHTLQRLRMKLGLNRPKEEYEKLLLHLDSNNNNNNIIKPGTKVKVKGLVKASVHNGKIGIIKSSKVCTSSIPREEHRRVGVEISDDNGGTVVVAIKIKNLESVSASATMMTTTTNTNGPNPHEYLVGRKDGTVHIGSTPNVI